MEGFSVHQQYKGRATDKPIKHCCFLLQVALMLFWYGGSWLQEHHKPRVWLLWASRMTTAVSRRPAWKQPELPVHAPMPVMKIHGSSGSAQGHLTIQASPPALGKVVAGRQAHEEA